MVASNAKDPDSLLACARVALSRVIVHQLIDNQIELPVITLDPALEQIVHKAVQQARQAGAIATDEMVLEPTMAGKTAYVSCRSSTRQETAGKATVLLVSPQIRPALYRFVRSSIPALSVLSYQEVPEDKQITIVASIGQ